MSMKKAFITEMTLFLIAGFLFVGIANAQTKTPAKSPAITKVDLNKATPEQLSKCSGITSTLAKAIVEYRVKSGLFKAPEDLLKVKGITKEIFTKAKPKMENNIIYLVPAASGDDEEEPSLKPSKC
jgi:competence ComEA-like helix-hairpin-helix protein